MYYLDSCSFTQKEHCGTNKNLKGVFLLFSVSEKFALPKDICTPLPLWVASITNLFAFRRKAILDNLFFWFFFLPLAFLASAYANLNFGIPHPFLVLMATFDNFQQFFDNSEISLSFK